MFSRRRLPLAFAAAGACLLVSAAAAAPEDTFTVSLTPSHVKTSTPASYTVAITHDSPSLQANRATIAIPDGFSVPENSVRASTTAASSCVAAEWTNVDVNDETIQVNAPGGSGGTRRLCRGATLTIVFQATSPARDGLFTWNTTLRGQEDEENVNFQPPNPQPTVVVDGTAPKALVTAGPPPLTNSRSATFAFSSDEPTSFACQLDGGGFHPCASAASYGGLGDGAHTFAVRATDAVGNTGAASSHGWTIDATAPDTTLGSAPRSGTTTLSASFAFSASEPGSFECKLDAASFAPCTSPRSYTGLRRGAHSFEVRAIDAAGNLELAAALHRWTIAAPKRAKATSALLAPRAGARVTSPPLLAWRRAARATYYNVQLFRGGVKVLSAWPSRTRLQLRSRWTYLGRQRRLSPGTYRWYVWPGYGRAAANRYGRLLGQRAFTFVAPGR